jgi:hypothetical protein
VFREVADFVGVYVLGLIKIYTAGGVSVWIGLSGTKFSAHGRGVSLAKRRRLWYMCRRPV